MKVAYVTFSRAVHGAEKRVIKLASDPVLTDAGITGYLFCNPELYHNALEDEELKQCLESLGSRLVLLPSVDARWRLVQKAISPLRLKYLQFKHEIDLFHLYLGALSWGGPIVHLGAKVIFEITSPDIADRFVDYAKKYTAMIRKLKGIICVSPSVFKRVRDQLDDQPARPLFKMERPFTRLIDPPSALAQTKDRLVIYASRFISRKNPVLFAQVAAKLLKDHPEWTVAMYGTGPLQSQVENILAEHIAQRRAIVGYTGNIVEALARARVVVSLIEPDNFPSQTLFEAMAMGNALVVLNTGASAQFVKGQNGLLVSKEDVAERLSNLLNDEDAVSRMGLRSAEMYDEIYSRKKYVSELKAIYTAVA